MAETTGPADSWKINTILVLVLLSAILLLYNVYANTAKQSDLVCFLNEEELQDSFILKNCSSKLSDGQLEQLSDRISEGLSEELSVSVENALENIFSGSDGEGAQGSGTEVICEYNCDQCYGQEECEPSEECVSTGGACGEQYSLECCEGLLCNEQGICEEGCSAEGESCSGTAGLDCCEGLDCENSVCVSTCVSQGNSCEKDSDCCYDMTCENGECAVCRCSETDSGDDPSTYGNTTGWWQASNECTKKKDTCSNNVLTEYFCGVSSYIEYTTYQCNCEGGACTDCEGYYGQCTNNADCCEGYECSYQTGYGDVCVPECEEYSGYCASASDCCEGLVCQVGQCRYCVEAQESCDTAYGDTCCEGYECTNGVCQVPQQDCEALGYWCDVSADCCDPLVCNYGYCSECGLKDYTCELGSDYCCPGYVCAVSPYIQGHYTCQEQ